MIDRFKLQDLRNHGESPHDKRHDYTAMAEDVSHFIREHNLKEPSIIGHSMYESPPELNTGLYARLAS